MLPLFLNARENLKFVENCDIKYIYIYISPFIII